MKQWKVTYVTDYPYSNSIIVEAEDEEGARKEFEKKTGYKLGDYCVIKEIK